MPQRPDNKTVHAGKQFGYFTYKKSPWFTLKFLIWLLQSEKSSALFKITHQTTSIASWLNGLSALFSLHSVAAYASRNVFKLVWYRWVAQCSCTTSKKWPPAHIHVYIITVSQPTFCSCCFVSSPPWSYLPVILLLSHLPTVITYLGDWYLGLSHLYTRSTAHIVPSPPPKVPCSRPALWLRVCAVVIPSGVGAQDPFIRWYEHL